MINHWQSKTAEEKRAIRERALATRARNRAEEQERHEAAERRRFDLQYGIEQLESRLAELRTLETMSQTAYALTTRRLLGEAEIVACATPANSVTGVYFLIRAARVVYVGQSINVFARITTHGDKNFDAFSYVACDRDQLDMLESLYIHLLSPPLNGEARNGGKAAPIQLDDLLRRAISR